MKRTHSLIAASLLLAWAGHAGAADTPAFTLGEISVVAPADDAPLPGASVLDSAAIRAENRETVGAALQMAAGVNLSRVGARNEQMAYVRGFDLRQVPVFVDGIPVYVPYDGYVDLGRFTTFDLARIEVAKGFSSLTYGPNTLGGAINLVSRRPSRAFEGEVGGGIELDKDGARSSYRAYGNVGLLRESWYLQAGAALVDEDGFGLPDSFDPVATENGGRRENSYRRDSKLSFKLGLTPNASDEYVLGYVRQDGKKGNPPYTGSVVSPRYWQWPYWDKTSLFIATHTQFGDHALKVRAYHDTYENSLYAYDDATYTTQNRRSSFRSWYDDYTDGLSVEGDFALATANRLRVAYHYKEDVHREHDAGEPEQTFRDRTQSFAVEDSHAVNARLTLVGGLSYDYREARRAESYDVSTGLVRQPVGDNDAVNAQLGAFYALDSGTLRATVARKSRFATIKDRYSFRLGTALPNPDLKTERATHYELGYSAALAGDWKVDAALFRSNVRDLIQSVRIDASQCSSPPCSQMQNVARARATGLELAVDGRVGALKLDANYLWLYRKNLEDATVRLTDTPRHKFFAAATWTQGAWQLGGSVEAASRRYTSSDGRQQAAGYAVANAHVGYRFAGGALVEAGVHNLFDRLYAYSEGFPEPGRRYYVNFNLPL
ncbi:TonB-dependent receptor plug domain-containing protein [Azoarcus olearius]|uniref:Probable TonB-dependent receptor n=1 Tax=Azoarcus sp. (strain BH72) TaxID=418699 RepID=A1KC96_AZOSB|nr:TonB-dependent receptor [Azoarcus olearius]CAL96452.1 probable TonB-dependent receptor [Azoarcus olearius]